MKKKSKKNVKNQWYVLTEIVLFVVVVYLFILSLFFKEFILPVRALLGLLFLTMAYTYNKDFKDKKISRIYLLCGLVAIAYFLVGVLVG